MKAQVLSWSWAWATVMPTDDTAHRKQFLLFCPELNSRATPLNSSVTDAQLPKCVIFQLKLNYENYKNVCEAFDGVSNTEFSLKLHIFGVRSHSGSRSHDCGNSSAMGCSYWLCTLHGKKYKKRTVSRENLTQKCDCILSNIVSLAHNHNHSSHFGIGLVYCQQYFASIIVTLFSLGLLHVCTNGSAMQNRVWTPNLQID